VKEKTAPDALQLLSPGKASKVLTMLVVQLCSARAPTTTEAPSTATLVSPPAAVFDGLMNAWSSQAERLRKYTYAAPELVQLPSVGIS